MSIEQFPRMLPAEIEARSMQLIEQELSEMGVCLPEPFAPIIKRVIHTTADFDYHRTLTFSPDVVSLARAALRQGATIVTDTQMAKAGMNAKALARFGVEVCCFIADADVAETAQKNGSTRAAAAVDKAAALGRPLIFVVGNAPTALIRLHELYTAGALDPIMVIGVPVGFVHVVESKELILDTGLAHIVARGRKGGSNVAAAIVNALLYGIEEETPHV